MCHITFRLIRRILHWSPIKCVTISVRKKLVRKIGLKNWSEKLVWSVPKYSLYFYFVSHNILLEHCYSLNVKSCQITISCAHLVFWIVAIHQLGIAPFRHFSLTTLNTVMSIITIRFQLHNCSSISYKRSYNRNYLSYQ